MNVNDDELFYTNWLKVAILESNFIKYMIWTTFTQIFIDNVFKISNTNNIFYKSITTLCMYLFTPPPHISPFSSLLALSNLPLPPPTAMELQTTHISIFHEQCLLNIVCLFFFYNYLHLF